MINDCLTHESYWLTDKNRLLAEPGNLPGLWEWWVWEFFIRGVDEIPFSMSVAGVEHSGVARLELPPDPVPGGPDPRTLVTFGDGEILRSE